MHAEEPSFLMCCIGVGMVPGAAAAEAAMFVGECCRQRYLYTTTNTEQFSSHITHETSIAIASVSWQCRYVTIHAKTTKGFVGFYHHPFERRSGAQGPSPDLCSIHYMPMGGLLLSAWGTIHSQVVHGSLSSSLRCRASRQPHLVVNGDNVPEWRRKASSRPASRKGNSYERVRALLMLMHLPFFPGG